MPIPLKIDRIRFRGNLIVRLDWALCPGNICPEVVPFVCCLWVILWDYQPISIRRMALR